MCFFVFLSFPFFFISEFNKQKNPPLDRNNFLSLSQVSLFLRKYTIQDMCVCAFPVCQDDMSDSCRAPGFLLLLSTFGERTESPCFLAKLLGGAPLLMPSRTHKSGW